MSGVIEVESDDFEFVEVDPTGRYGRFDEILGKGASKTVYRGFDEYEGIEVAWNQVKLYDFMKSPDDLERLYCEIHLLKTLKHKNIMKFYTSWVDVSNRNINFVTEMFTSGTLRQYRHKHKRVNIRAVKLWCRQILEGLCYLHSRDPPVIHRDLKCDNIFINGNQGEVKIGDLGLAAILRKSHVARCVGTPEFMAPEVYTEEYNELVDIYSFGMCILEMMTFEYPYSECSHPARIYKNVISGKKPEALYKVKDPEVRQFVEKCLATVSHRLSARELLDDPFLHVDDYTTSDFRSLSCAEDYETWPMLKQPLLNHHHHSINSDYVEFGHDDDLDHHANEVDLFTSEDDDDDDRWENADISIKGRRRGDDSIFLRLRITDKEGHLRNIYFPFDTETDTALSVATEMVAELDITDQDVSKIAEMIDTEIASLVPSWKRSPIMEEHLDYANNGCYHKCASEGHLVDYLSSHGPGSRNLQVIKSSRHGWGTLQGRFEEITFQFDGSEQCNTEYAPDSSCESDGIHWAEYDKLKLTPRDSCGYHLDEQERLTFETNARIADIDKENKCYENEIRQELSWLKAKYETQLTEQVEKKCARIYKKTAYGFCSPEHMVTAKSFYTPLHRATSLPVDAMDV